MAYCPNIKCGHRALTGSQAEYRSGFEKCTECGETLVQGQPPASSTQGAPRLPAAIKRRVWLTILFAGLLFTAMWLPNPLVDTFAISDMGLGNAMEVGAATGPLSMGITSFISAFIGVEIVALIIPPLRRRRLTDPALRKKMWKAALITGFALSFIRGISTAYWLESVLFYDWGYSMLDDSVALGPGWAFRLLQASLFTAGTGLYFFAAWLVNRFGIGRGFAVVLMVEILAGVPHTIADLARSYSVGAISFISVAVQAGVITGMILGLRWFFLRADRTSRTQPFTMPTCGTFPLESGAMLVLLPATLTGFLYPEWIQMLAFKLSPGTMWHLILQLVLIAALSFPASAMFYWKTRRDLASGPHKSAWLKARLASAGLLGALIVGWHLAVTWLSGGSIILLPDVLTLLLAVVLLWDWLHEISVHRGATGPLQLVGEHHDMTDALNEISNLRAREDKRRVALTGVKFRSLTYIFGPYVPMQILSEADPAEFPKGPED